MILGYFERSLKSRGQRFEHLRGLDDAKRLRGAQRNVVDGYLLTLFKQERGNHDVAAGSGSGPNDVVG